MHLNDAVAEDVSGHAIQEWRPGMASPEPEIQQHVLSLPDMVRRPAITERALRPIAHIENHKQQLAAFSTVLGHGSASNA
ncbi:hypothetical protein [Nitrospira sp. Kam-Ns4a]